MTNTYTWPGSTWTVGFDSIFDRLEKLNTQQLEEIIQIFFLFLQQILEIISNNDII